MNFYTSDIHAAHSHLALYRGFVSTEEMEDTIVQNFNSILTKRDTLYHLGDFYWKNDLIGIKKFIARLNFRKLIFLKGNHDKPLIRYMKQTKDSRLELHNDLFLKDGGCHLHLYHYPTFDWEGRYNTDHNGAKYYHLFGHQHRNQNGEPMNLKGAVNVNVDMNNYMPLNINDIVDIVKKQK